MNGSSSLSIRNFENASTSSTTHNIVDRVRQPVQLYSFLQILFTECHESIRHLVHISSFIVEDQLLRGEGLKFFNNFFYSSIIECNLSYDVNSFSIPIRSTHSLLMSPLHPHLSHHLHFVSFYQCLVYRTAMVKPVSSNFGERRKHRSAEMVGPFTHATKMGDRSSSALI